VAREGKGLDFALEVTFEGSRKKDLVDNVSRFARLGIPEYFAYDRKRQRLHGYRLPAAGGDYEPIVPQQGRWHSMVLGLDLGIEGDRFRFYLGTAVVPELSELVERANSLVFDLQAKLESLTEQLAREQERAEQEQQRAEQEQQRAEQEQQRAEFAERRLSELQGELDRLKKR
jgi:hypothetical protein